MFALIIMPHDLKIFSGNSNKEFSNKVAHCAKVPLSKCNVSRFKDGEVQVEISESVRGTNCFIIQSTCPPVNENYMELFIMLDALRRASANNITAVLPYYGYSRQDRKVATRAPISANTMAKLLETAGADRVVSIDLHSPQIQGFFNGPIDHLYATRPLAQACIKKIKEAKNFTDVVIVSPDSGGIERARAFAKQFKATIAIIDKRRNGPGQAKAFNLIGDVVNKTVIIVDDIIDTAGTLVQSIDTLIKNKAKRVFAVATHPVFSDIAIERLEKCEAEAILVTDTIPLSEKAKKCSKIEQVSLTDMVAESICRINSYNSVSELFD